MIRGPRKKGLCLTTKKRSPQELAKFVAELLPQLEAMDIVERYAWFHGDVSGAALTSSQLFKPDGSPTGGRRGLPGGGLSSVREEARLAARWHQERRKERDLTEDQNMKKY